MKDTFGPMLFDLSENADREPSSESKSPARMGEVGLISSEETSNLLDMNSSQQSCQQPPAERHINDTDSSGEPSKTCCRCKQKKPLNQFRRFGKRSLDGLRYSCSACEKVPERKRRQVKRMTSRAAILVRHAKVRAAKKNRAFNLDVQRIQEIINAGVCELTGIPFDLAAKAAWNSPSLDRIDPKQGYTMENIRVVLYCVNVMSNLWGENKIVEIGNAIMQTRVATSSSLQSRLTAVLKSIGLENSPEYSLEWMESTMPSGRTIPVLRASSRTSDSGCSGWPTPAAKEFEHTDMENLAARRAEIKAQGINGNGFGLTLGMASQLAGWLTPQSHDQRGGKTEDQIAEMRERSNAGVSNLNEVAQLAGWATPTATDSRTEPTPAQIEHVERQRRERPKGAPSKLGIQVALAGWATPQATDGSKAPPDHHDRNLTLVGQAKLSGWNTPTTNDAKQAQAQAASRNLSGQTRESFTVETGSTDGFLLNPRYSLWLQGYPDVWASCGERAMQSCRRWPRNSSKPSLKPQVAAAFIRAFLGAT